MIDRLDIHAYADGELAPEEMARVEREIAASPEATRELESIVALKQTLVAKHDAYDCSSAWKHSVGRLNELDRVKKAESFVGKYAWALCILLFGVIVGSGLLHRARGGSVGMGQVASIASDFVPLGTPRLSQPEQLRSWITDQTGQRPTIFLDPQRVVGLAYVDRPEGRIVRVRMRDAQGFLDVMILPNVGSVDGGQPLGGGVYAGQVNGLNCVTWADSGCAVLVIGNRDPEALRTFGKSLYH